MSSHLPTQGAFLETPDAHQDGVETAKGNPLQQSRELQRVNQRLVEESELLRLALAETDSLRQREAAVLRERTILFDALTVLSNARSSSAALHALLVNLGSIYQACPACLLVAADTGFHVQASADEKYLGLHVPLVSDAVCQARRMASLQPLGTSPVLPEELRCLRSLLMVPLPLAGVSNRCALLLGVKESGHFSASDLRVVERIAALAQPILMGLHEVEERERLQRELQVAQRREMIGQVAAGLAHDFNNLLAAIGGNASLIGSDVQAGSAAATGAGRIQAAVDQAGGLVRRLLALGARQPERSLIDLNLPVRQAADLLQANLRPPLTLEVRLCKETLEVLADPTDIMQLLLNLGINARDAMQERMQGVITLSLGVATVDDLAGECLIGQPDPGRRYMALGVKDQGPGIAHDKLELVFKRYVTTKGDQGSGLGLAIVASIVTANQAALKVVSTPGEGCHFLILWPEKAAEEKAQRPSPAVLSGNLAGCSVLVVDDQQAVLTVITEMLEEAGAEVAPTNAPADVVEALRDDPGAWDLVITDYDMPEMSGDELACQVRQQAPGLPVLLITALASIRPLSGKMFDACIEKPVNKERLIGTVERLVSR